jgi:hypothetical protein
VAAERVHPAARTADVAQQELKHRRGADDLHAGRVLGPAQRVHDGADPLGVAVEVTTSATFRNWALGVPQIFSTISGV